MRLSPCRYTHEIMTSGRRLIPTAAALVLACSISARSASAQVAGSDAAPPVQPVVPAQPPADAPAQPPAQTAPADATPPATPAPAPALQPAVPSEPQPSAPAAVAPSPEATAPAAAQPQPPPAPAPAAEPAPEPGPARAGLLERPAEVEGWNEESGFDPDLRTYTGLSIRLGAGLGLASAKRNLDKGSNRVSGFDGLITLDVGAAAIENLIVYGRIGGFALNHASSGDSPNAGNAYFGMLGAGARYHFMPIDWYASATLSLAAASVTNDLGVVENAHPGLGFEIETGKDFWAGTDRDKRTVGLGLRFGYVRCASLGNRDSKPWVGTALSLVFATSYN